MFIGTALSVVAYAFLLGSDAQGMSETLTEVSTFSVIVAVFALTIVVAIGFGVFLIGFLRLIARRSV